MSDMPRHVVEPVADVISTVSRYSVWKCGISGMQWFPATNAWPTANRAFFYPFVIEEPTTVAVLWVMNGSAVSGNIDVGVYDRLGNLLISSGSTLQAGTNAIQSFNVTDTPIPAGLYYLALALDNTTGQVFRGSIMGGNIFLTTLGGWEQTSAFPLPNPATFATSTFGSVAVVGFTSRSSM